MHSGDPSFTSFIASSFVQCTFARAKALRTFDADGPLDDFQPWACIHKPPHQAFARAKVHWAKMDAEKLVKDGSQLGKEHRHPEMYYEGVLKGSRLVADECAKDVIFE